MLIIRHATLYTPETRLDDATVYIDNGIIANISSDVPSSVPAGAQTIDARGSILAPGLLDLQLNGAFGDDFTANPETIWRVAAGLPRFGITSFLPTLVTCPLSQADAAIQVLKERPEGFRGAEPLGLHLEGPFLNPKKKGAHNPEYMRAPDTELVPHWSRRNGVWLVTLAPELPGALALVEDLATRGVIVSMGHTMATVDEANAGYASGIQYATHLFNAMPPLEHRAPGAAGAVLANPQWFAGLIPDGVHVHPALVKAVWLAKGMRGVNLVSDAMAALGMKPGTYRLHDFECTVSESAARLQDGTLAGSTLPLDQGVRNLMEYTGCSISEALQTVTTNPARLLDLLDQRGRIAPGMIADLILMDSRWNVKMTLVRGEIAYPD